MADANACACKRVQAFFWLNAAPAITRDTPDARCLPFGYFYMVRAFFAKCHFLIVRTAKF
jgi:hypothetical protein